MSIDKSKWYDTDIPENVQLYARDSSGNLIPVAVNESGRIVTELSSGQVTVLSGELIAKTSGETVSVASGHYFASGIGVVTTPAGGGQVSGAVVVSGDVKISGETVVIASGHYFASGIGVVTTPAGGGQVSGAVQVSGTVAVSGEVIAKNSGETVSLASGHWFASGIGVVTSPSGGGQVSGAVVVSGDVKVSGETIVVASGAEIIWRGVQVSGSVIVSGDVKVSGEIVSIASGEKILATLTDDAGTNIANIVSGHHSLLTESYERYKIILGDTYEVAWYDSDSDTASGTVVYAEFPTSGEYHLTYQIATDTPGILEVWDEAIASGGSALYAHNLNRVTNNSSIVDFYHTPSYESGTGNNLEVTYVPADNQGGGLFREEDYFIFQSGKVLFIFYPDSANARTTLNINYYEVL